jgi:hypothetical protein
MLTGRTQSRWPVSTCNGKVCESLSGRGWWRCERGTFAERSERVLTEQRWPVTV